MTGIPAGLDTPRRRHLVGLAQVLVAPGEATLTKWLNTHSLPSEDARWLSAQHLSPFAFHRLRTSGRLAQVPEESRALLQANYSHSAMREAFQHQDAAGILQQLNTFGVDSVVLKGLALAQTVYPSPRCRPKSDLDVWVQPEQRAAAIAALCAVGYTPRLKAERSEDFTERFDGELQLYRDPAEESFVELQWPVIRGEWARRCARVDHAAMWKRRIPVTIEGYPTATLSPEDTLLHLCFHQAINHQFTLPCWMRSLLDIHLLVQQPIEWSQVVTRARAWHLATVTWCGLDLAQRLLATPIPAEVLASLAPSHTRQRLLRRLDLEGSVLEMWPSAYHHSRLLLQLLLVDHLRDALRLMGRGLFPEAEWIQARYAPATRRALWRQRLLHCIRLLTSTRT